MVCNASSRFKKKFVCTLKSAKTLTNWRNFLFETSAYAKKLCFRRTWTAMWFILNRPTRYQFVSSFSNFSIFLCLARQKLLGDVRKRCVRHPIWWNSAYQRDNRFVVPRLQRVCNFYCDLVWSKLLFRSKIFITIPGDPGVYGVAKRDLEDKSLLKVRRIDFGNQRQNKYFRVLASNKGSSHPIIFKCWLLE